jgi:hypothetical protein
MRQYLLSIIVISMSIACLDCLDCDFDRPLSADLTPLKAAEIIASSPGFNRYRQLVSVEKTLREGDSLADCCYNAWFTFRFASSGSEGKPIPATAQFRWFDGAWHLDSYSYGDPPNVETVWVHDGVPHS